MQCSEEYLDLCTQRRNGTHSRMLFFEGRVKQVNCIHCESPLKMEPRSPGGLTPTCTLPKVLSIAYIMVGWGNVSQRFHLSAPVTGMTHMFFHTLTYVMTHIIISGLVTLRATTYGTASLGIYYLWLSNSCFRINEASWMWSEMS